jgi:hypothetical protein
VFGNVRIELEDIAVAGLVDVVEGMPAAFRQKGGPVAVSGQEGPFHSYDYSHLLHLSWGQQKLQILSAYQKELLGWEKNKVPGGLESKFLRICELLKLIDPFA